METRSGRDEENINLPRVLNTNTAHIHTLRYTDIYRPLNAEVDNVHGNVSAPIINSTVSSLNSQPLVVWSGGGEGRTGE